MIRSLILVPLMAIVGCSATPTPLQLGIGGAAVGAGVGAGVGALITRGNIGQSAGLGAAIGLPVGVLYGVIRDEMKENEQEARIQLVKDRQAAIYARERQLERYRREVEAEAPQLVMPWPPTKKYLGPSLGNPYR